MSYTESRYNSLAFDAGESPLSKFQQQQIKLRRERNLTEESNKIRQAEVDSARSGTQRRIYRQRPPVGTDPVLSKDMKRGVVQQDIQARELQDSFEQQGIGSEQNRKLLIDKEHALSLESGGPDYDKLQFSGSARQNRVLGPKNAFTPEQIRTLGLPTDWSEAITDKQAFGKDTMANLTNNDWIRLQQKEVTDQELLGHKMFEQDLESKGQIWIDAESTEEVVQRVDVDQGKQSLKKHFKKDHFPSQDSLAEGQNLKARQLNQKLSRNPDTFDIKKLKIGEGLSKQTGKLSKAQAMAELGLHVSSGNIPGAVVSASALSAHAAAQNPTVQKKFAELVIKIVQDKGAKQAGKLIPGVDVGISAMEAWGYLSRGRVDQAGIAALSGAIGWVPGLGDFGAALLDATNLAIDVKRGDFSKKKPEIVENKSATTRLSKQAQDHLDDIKIDKRSARVLKNLF